MILFSLQCQGSVEVSRLENLGELGSGEVRQFPRMPIAEYRQRKYMTGLITFGVYVETRVALLTLVKASTSLEYGSGIILSLNSQGTRRMDLSIGFPL